MTIRKALPLLWRYLALVAVSCTLAFVISREGRAAPAPSTAGLAVPTANPVPTVEADYAATGRYAIAIRDDVWRDEARQRGVPIRVISPAVAGVERGTKLPVIIFSHGLGGGKNAGKMWGEHWASHGYIVVHLQHPGSDESIWKRQPTDQVEGSLKRAMTISNLGLRVGDVHFVLDEIVRRAQLGTGEFKLANSKKIGMSGHSFGAQTTLAIAGHATPGVGGQSGFDKRISAALAFSPNARNKNRLDKQFGDIRMPVLSITGTKDGAVLNDGTKYEDRTLPYKHMPAGDKYLLVLNDADHMVFGGLNTARRRSATPRDAEIQSDVKAVTLAFWDAYLKGDAPAKGWLAPGKPDKNGIQNVLAANDRYDAK